MFKPDESGVFLEQQLHAAGWEPVGLNLIVLSRCMQQGTEFQKSLWNCMLGHGALLSGTDSLRREFRGKTLQVDTQRACHDRDTNHSYA
jgi:hypothetical protein